MLNTARWSRRVLGSAQESLSANYQHPQPLLFLYPRWFASGTGQHNQRSRSANDTQRASSAAAKPTNVTLGQHRPRDAEDVRSTNVVRRIPNTKPSKRLEKYGVGRKRGEESVKKRALRLRLGFTDALDWRECLSLLQKSTAYGKDAGHTRHVRCLRLPDSMEKLFSGDARELFLGLLWMTECHVQVMPQTSENDQGRVLVLHGSLEAIRRAEERLRKSFGLKEIEVVTDKSGLSAQLLHAPIDPDSDRHVSPRATWSVDYMSQLQIKNMVFEEISAPEKWSVTSFAIYVETLVLSKPPRQKLQTQYGPTSPQESQSKHQKQVADALVEAFCRPQVRRYYSHYACTRALCYLGKRQRFPEVRQIFLALEEKKVKMAATVFNRLLSFAAKSQDLHNYHFILKMMLARDIRPSWETWATLVDLVSRRSHRTAGEVIKRMRERQLLEPYPACMAVAECVVRHDFQQWTESNRTVLGFIDEYDKRWQGKHWMSEDCTNSMLSVLAVRGDFQQTDVLLDIMQDRDRKTTIRALNILLKACADQGNVEAAIAFTNRLLDVNLRTHPDAITFKELHRLAYTRRNYNLWRVVWRYACMSGHVSFNMHTTVWKSLLKWHPVRESDGHEASAEAPSRNEIFTSLAGNVAAGLSAFPTASQQSLASCFTQQYLALYGKDTRPRSRQKGQKGLPYYRTESYYMVRNRQLHNIVRADMAQYGQLKPVRPLSDMLRLAYEKDKQWKEEGLRGDLDEMLQRAIQIPVGRSIN